MADKNIGLLPPVEDVYDDTKFPAEQQGEAVQVTGAQIKGFARDAVKGDVTDAKAAAEAAKASQTAAEAAQGKAEEAQTAAETAKGAAETAQTAAEAAQTGAETAKNAAETAQSASETAQTGAEAAQGKAEQAKTAAETAKTAAETAALDSETAKTAAQTAQQGAEAAQTAAETAKGAAESAKTAAEAASTAAAQSAGEAADSAETAKEYSGKPAIPQNGTWWIWNAEAQEYQDSGKKALLNWDKTYPSVEAMEADAGNVEVNTVAIISSDVNSEDNAKIFVFDGTAWRYLADLSGFAGVGIAAIELTSGNHAPGTTDIYTITLTDGSTKEIPVYNGADGEGSGDMTAAVYDPTGKSTDIFAYVDEKVKDIDPANLKNVVTIADGARMELAESMGEGPYVLEADEDFLNPDIESTADRIQYDNTNSKLEAGNVQTAIDQLAENKQEKINGTADQVAGFDQSGNLVARGTEDLKGKDATINGVNTLTIEAGENVELVQDGNTLTINVTGGTAPVFPVKLEITTPPNKTAYLSGEAFDPTGMVVTATYSNGNKAEITGYSWTPEGPLTDGTTEITILYTETGVTLEAKQPVTVGKALTGIEITTPPTKTAYQVNDAFDPAGMVVTASYTDGSREAVTGYTFAPERFASAGSQTVTVTYTENGITKTAETTVSVALIPVAVPVQAGSLTYTGAAQSPSWTGYDTDAMIIGGVTSGTEAGSYGAVFTLKAGYCWTGGDTEAKTVQWTIGRATLEAVPSQSGSLTYNGQAQKVSLSGYDAEKMTLGGQTSATDAGSYTATAAPKANYQWPDGSTSAKDIPWTIAKAAGSLTLSAETVSLSAESPSAEITVTSPGDGVVSAVSSNTGIAQVSVSGKVVTITGIASGTATVTISVGEGTNYTAPANKAVSVAASFLPAVGTPLNDLSWADIRKISDAGLASAYFAHGDRKAVALNGTVGNLTLNGTYYCYILSPDHNRALEGENRIHFQFGYTALSGGTQIAFADSGYDSEKTSGTWFNMNNSRSNSGGWKSSAMRKNLGNDGTPASPSANTFLAALPSDLRAVMKPVTKYTDNTGGGSNTASYVTTTVDYLFLLAEFEVFGAREYANSAEQNYQVQYDYYKNGNSKVAYNHSATSTAVWWWLRSPDYRYDHSFCNVNSRGSTSYYYAFWSAGVRPCFCV